MDESGGCVTFNQILNLKVMESYLLASISGFIPWTELHPSKFMFETLTPKVTLFGDRDFRR